MVKRHPAARGALAAGTLSAVLAAGPLAAALVSALVWRGMYVWVKLWDLHFATLMLWDDLRFAALMTLSHLDATQWLILISATVALLSALAAAAPALYRKLQADPASPRSHLPPGFWLQAWGEHFLSPKTYSEILEPTLRDLQDEAAAASTPSKRCSVLARGYGSFVCTLGTLVLTELLDHLTQLWKAPP